MRPPGRPKGEYRSAQHEGSPMRPPGRPKGEYLRSQHEGSPATTAAPPAAARTAALALAITLGIQVYTSLATAATAVLAPEIARDLGLPPALIGVFVGLTGLPSCCALRYSPLGRPGGLTGLPSCCALRYSPLGRPGGLTAIAHAQQKCILAARRGPMLMAVNAAADAGAHQGVDVGIRPSII